MKPNTATRHINTVIAEQRGKQDWSVSRVVHSLAEE